MNELEMWKIYQDSHPKATRYEAWCFCDGGDIGDHLADLVLAGKKTATASALELYAIEGDPVPMVGGLSIVLSSDGQASCIIETIGVHICRFCDVTSEHAYNEGEGDRSLEYWRRVHEQFFLKELEQDFIRI